MTSQTTHKPLYFGPAVPLNFRVRIGDSDYPVTATLAAIGFKSCHCFEVEVPKLTGGAVALLLDPACPVPDYLCKMKNASIVVHTAADPAVDPADEVVLEVYFRQEEGSMQLVDLEFMTKRMYGNLLRWRLENGAEINK